VYLVCITDGDNNTADLDNVISKTQLTITK
jgi:hypothetical protein